MTLTIDSKTRFFIAISKIKAHSFIMTGTHDNFKVQHLLCRVGKIFDLNSNSNNPKPLGSILSALFKVIGHYAKAKIKDEGLNRDRLEHSPISYQAYEISYKQYLDFIHLLESIEDEDNSIECFKPVEQTYDQIVLAPTIINLNPPTPVDKNILIASTNLSFDNTCRHGAIKIIEEVIRCPVSSIVSPNFLTELPCATYLDYGVPSQDVPFYVLPVPPNYSLNLSKQKQSVIERLYKRMEQLVKLEPNSKLTQKKFTCLKNLYNDIVGDPIELTISELLQKIKNWKQTNWSTLSGLRKTYFWDTFIKREASTLKTIKEIEAELEIEDSNSLSFLGR